MFRRRRQALLPLSLTLSALLGLVVLAPSVSTPRVEATPTYTASSIAAGASITCAITSGNVRCFGDDTFGRLGIPISPYSSWGNSTNQMGRFLFNVSLGSGRTATQIAVGNNHGCALLDNGQVKCWGDNGSGQLGVGDTQRRGTGAVSGYNGSMGANLPAVNLGTNLSVTRLRAGGNATCAILDDSSLAGTQSIVKCWGMNGLGGRMGQGVQGASGDLGKIAGDIAAFPGIDVGLTAGQAVDDLVMGNEHTCVLISNGDVKCWGENASGQLGKDNQTDLGDNTNEMGSNLTAINLGTNMKAVAIAAGKEYVCAVLDNSSTTPAVEGAVKCWGENTSGQLGVLPATNRGDAANEMAGLVAVTLPAGRKAVSVAAGFTHTCVVLDDSSVSCWGTNDTGQAGRDNTTPVYDGQSTTLGLGATTASLALGNRHSCALATTGTVKCWGFGGGGQLGRENSDSVGDSAGEMAALSVIDLSPYIAPITLSSSTPSNGSTNVTASADFMFVFDQTVTAVAGKNIRIKLLTGGTTIETIAANDVAKVTSSVGGTTITVNPSGAFAGNTWYCIEIDSGAFENAGTGASYGGLSSSALCYRTATIPPSVTTRSPAHNATGVAKSSNIELTYDQQITTVAGNQIEIRSRDGVTFESMFVTNSSRVSIDGLGFKVTINPTNDLEEGTEYCVVVPAGAFRNSVTSATTTALAFPDYCFTTVGTAPGGSSGGSSSGGSNSSTPTTASAAGAAVTTATTVASEGRDREGPTVRDTSATITFVPKTDLRFIDSFEFSIDDRQTWDEAETTTLDDGRVRFTVTDLTPATNYEVVIRAVTTNGRRIIQGEVSFRTKAELPATGFSPSGLLTLVGSLTLLGLGLMLARRRFSE